MNKSLIICGIFTGILCGAWAGAAPAFNLSVWAGFAGCTAYFACGQHGVKGVQMTTLTTLLGVLTGYLMLHGSNIIGNVLPSAWSVGIAVGAIVTLIVFCSAVPLVSFVPGIFVGCYSFFAIDGDWKLLGLSLIAGIILGVICDRGGALLAQQCVKSNANR